MSSNNCCYTFNCYKLCNPIVVIVDEECSLGKGWVTVEVVVGCKLFSKGDIGAAKFVELYPIVYKLI